MVRVKVGWQKFEAERVVKSVEEKHVWDDDGWRKQTRSVVHIYPTERDPAAIMAADEQRKEGLEHTTDNFDIRVNGDMGAVIQTDEYETDEEQIRFFGEFETSSNLDYRTGNDI